MDRKRNSIRFNIIISFIVVIATTFFLIGLLVYSSWTGSAQKVVNQMEKHTVNDIMEKMESFFDTPSHINEANHYFFENGIIDIKNKDEREKYFAGILKSNKDEVYSFTYGTESGEYYGARRNKNDEIEIIENNSSTDGSSFYYSTTKDLTVGKLVEKTAKFDPRTRDWYIAAKENKKPVFAPVYRHFVMNDLAVSAAYPIYNKAGELQGVLGTHIMLSKINSYLKEITKDKGASAFIVERNTGELVGNSLEKPNFETHDGDKTKRITIGEIAAKQISDAYESYKKDSKGNFVVKTDNDKFHVAVISFKKGSLDWLVITSIPESEFTADISKSIKFSVLLSSIALLTAILFYMNRTELIFKPVYDLISAAEKFSAGDFSYKAKVFRNDEIGKLSNAFNKMAEQLCSLINNLEVKVKERTTNLEKINKEVVYLSYHDQLTGLYNRRYFEEELIRLDTPENYPLALIMGDVNGLKLLNDAFGHAVGDKLIQKTAEIIKQGCREQDIAARLGGDEFAIILPKTESQETEEILKSIKEASSKEKIEFVEISIAFGYDIKRNGEESTEHIFKKAEDNMYKAKLIEKSSIKEETVKAIVNTLNEKNKTEEAHSRRVSHISIKLGKALGLSDKDIQELKTAALLHDIGKIAIEDSILEKPGMLNEEEWEQIRHHPAIGYRILNNINGMSEISKYVLAHHERWDGTGYPKGLKETEIPLQSRIIAVADAYEAMTRKRSYSNALVKEEVKSRLIENAGTQFDPQVVEALIENAL